MMVPLRNAGSTARPGSPLPSRPGLWPQFVTAPLTIPEASREGLDSLTSAGCGRTDDAAAAAAAPLTPTNSAAEIIATASSKDSPRKEATAVQQESSPAATAASGAPPVTPPVTPRAGRERHRVSPFSLGLDQAAGRSGGNLDLGGALAADSNLSTREQITSVVFEHADNIPMSPFSNDDNGELLSLRGITGTMKDAKRAAKVDNNPAGSSAKGGDQYRAEGSKDAGSKENTALAMADSQQERPSRAGSGLSTLTSYSSQLDVLICPEEYHGENGPEDSAIAQCSSEQRAARRGSASMPATGVDIKTGNAAFWGGSKSLGISFVDEPQRNEAAGSLPKQDSAGSKMPPTAPRGGRRSVRGISRRANSPCSSDGRALQSVKSGANPFASPFAGQSSPTAASPFASSSNGMGQPEIAVRPFASPFIGQAKSAAPSPFAAAEDNGNAAKPNSNELRPVHQAMSPFASPFTGQAKTAAASPFAAQTSTAPPSPFAAAEENGPAVAAAPVSSSCGDEQYTNHGSFRTAAAAAAEEPQAAVPGNGSGGCASFASPFTAGASPTSPFAAREEGRGVDQEHPAHPGPTANGDLDTHSADESAARPAISKPLQLGSRGSGIASLKGAGDSKNSLLPNGIAEGICAWTADAEEAAVHSVQAEVDNSSNSLAGAAEGQPNAAETAAQKQASMPESGHALAAAAVEGDRKAEGGEGDALLSDERLIEDDEATPLKLTQRSTTQKGAAELGTASPQRVATSMVTRDCPSPSRVEIAKAANPDVQELEEVRFPCITVLCWKDGMYMPSWGDVLDWIGFSNFQCAWVLAESSCSHMGLQSQTGISQVYLVLLNASET